jgi:hypothetical protein
MARRKRGDDETGEWPGGDDEGAQPEPTQTPSTRPKEVTYLTPQGIQTMSTDPTDLDDYEGEYKQLTTGETFGLKMVENDPQGRTHHLKNVDHYWAGTAEEFRHAFEKQ